MLSERSWGEIQRFFGGRLGHTFDLMALDSNSMKDRSGNHLPHFTPFPTPKTSGVNVFAQTLHQAENYHVFPPFNLTLPVINLVISNSLNCSLVLRCENSVPVWLPAVQEKMSDAFLIGLKGCKGCLKFPSKHGYVNDKVGLASNLWVIRLTDKVVSLSYGQLLFRRHHAIGKNYNLVCLGDSIIRGIGDDGPLFNPMVHVIAYGGATISRVASALVKAVSQFPPRVIILHCGVNNLSKTQNYADEFHQMHCTMQELADLENRLRAIQMKDKPEIVLSMCMVTKDPTINARAKLLNEEFFKCCLRNGWTFLTHENIGTLHLRDTLHLNGKGRQIFVGNILNVLQKIM